MKQFYQELFDHVAFPVFATDQNGIVIYKNPQAKKYHPCLRCRAKVQKHLKTSFDGRTVVLSGNTPFPVGLRLTHGENSLCLFLSRFQQTDGKKILKKMAEAFGTEAGEFLSRCRRTLSEGAAVDRTYSDLLLITEQEATDFGTSPQAIDTLLTPFFEKLPRFSVLGYRIDARIDGDFSARQLVRIAPQELFHRVSHWLYLMMKLSRSKNLSVLLSTESEGFHALSIRAETSLPAARYEKEALLTLVPECETEMRILSSFSDLLDHVALSVTENGIAELVCKMPCEKALHALSLHSETSLFTTAHMAKRSIAQLFKKLSA